MNASTEVQSKDWGWGYVLHVKPVPIAIQSVRILLVLHDGCSAWAHVANATTGAELAKSLPTAGKGGGEEWYHFIFGSTLTGTLQQEWISLPAGPDPAALVSLAIFVHCSAPGHARPPNQLIYVADHRPARRLNPYMTIEASSFDSSGQRTAKSRHVIAELTVTADGFDLDRGPAEVLPEIEHGESVEEVLAAEIDRIRMRAADPGNESESGAEGLRQKRVRLRRLVLDWADEPLEARLGPMPDSPLRLDVPARGACGYNFRTEEYWVVNVDGPGSGVQVWCCGLDGALRRTVCLDNVPRMHSLSFDRAGWLYMADSERSCLAFRPVEPAVSDRFLRPVPPPLPSAFLSRSAPPRIEALSRETRLSAPPRFRA
jgi:hypothetical protein